MADESIVKVIQQYLRALVGQGLPVECAVIFGSQARGSVHQWSDIDVLVVSPRYDQQHTWDDVSQLWRTAARTDSRIEPIPVGSRQFAEDDFSAIIAAARREGQKVMLSA